MSKAKKPQWSRFNPPWLTGWPATFIDQDKTRLLAVGRYRSAFFKGCMRVLTVLVALAGGMALWWMIITEIILPDPSLPDIAKFFIAGLLPIVTVWSVGAIGYLLENCGYLLLWGGDRKFQAIFEPGALHIRRLARWQTFRTEIAPQFYTADHPTVEDVRKGRREGSPFGRLDWGILVHCARVMMRYGEHEIELARVYGQKEASAIARRLQSLLDHTAKLGPITGSGQSAPGHGRPPLD